MTAQSPILAGNEPSAADPPAPTNSCPGCPRGRLTVYATRVDYKADLRIRYRRCRACGYRPAEPELIPLTAAPRHTRRQKRGPS